MMSVVSSVVSCVRDSLLPEPVFDFWCEEFGLINRRRLVVAKAVNVIRETPNAVSIWLKPNANFLGVQPGQHVNIGVQIDGRMVQRSYSVSGVKGRLFRITARKVENGKLSSFINDHAKQGMLFHIGEVYGDITVAQFDEKPALFLAGGIGITPIISMVESWSASIRRQPVELVYWGKRAQDLAFVDRLKSLSLKHHWFSFRILETEFLERNSDGAPKLFAETSAWFQDLKSRLPSFEAFACGNDGFVEQIRERFAPWVNNFHFESFSPIAMAGQVGAPINVHLSKQQRSVMVPSGVNLLRALEAAGVQVASGCRRGTCNTCSCKKTSGIALHQGDKKVNEAVDSAFKPCTHSALSDLTLEL